VVITNRDLPVGTRLVGKYKKQTFVCTVGLDKVGGTPVYVLEDGKEFKSPSSAASHVMGGGAVNGWRFWSLEGEAAAPKAEKPAKREPKSKAEKAPAAKAARKPRATKKFKLFDRLPDEDGEKRFWCHGCQASFASESDQPEVCVNGHRADDPELTAAPAQEAVEAEREPVAVEA
jgi:hypothetical protein